MVTKTKFDRLLDIIQKGKTFAMRKAAAYQIGFLQQEFSYDFSFLLNRLYPLLLHHDFDCRRATALALRELIPRSRANSQVWDTNRPLMKITDFDISRALKCQELAHDSTTHLSATSDYKDQHFEVNPDLDINELCQISDRMIDKLSSPNWFYRHGAVLCLLETIRPNVPSNYLEDLAVHLLQLLTLDRFKDFGADDRTIFPVREPACQLLARCLMRSPEIAFPIIEQFRLNKSIWELRFSFWLICKNMIMIDKSCVDSAWFQSRLMEALYDLSDADDIACIAMEAIAPIITQLPNITEVVDRIWELLFQGELDSIASYNSICVELLQKALMECNEDSFLKGKALDLIIRLCKSSQSTTRQAAYNLLISIFSIPIHPIFDSCDFKELIVKIYDVILEETTHISLAIDVIPAYGKLLESRNIKFDEEYCVYSCEALAVNFKKLKLIMAILVGLGNIVGIDKSKPQFQGMKSAWSIAYLIIICLSANTAPPEFLKIKQAVLEKDLQSLLMKMFSLDPDEVPDIMNKIPQQNISISHFISKIIGRVLKEKKRKDIIIQLISTNVKEISDVLNKVENEKEPTSFPELMKEYHPSPLGRVTQLIAINGVYEPPEDINNIFSLVHLLMYVESGQELPVSMMREMVRIMQESEYNIATLTAYISDKYTQRHPVSFLSEFVKFTFDHRLSLGSAEYIDQFLVSFDNNMDYLQWGSFFVKPCLQNFSNQDPRIRRIAAHSLAEVVRLLALDNGDVSKLPNELCEAKLKSMEYLAPLFDITKAPLLEINPPPCFTDDPSGHLRDYQISGINWLGFLYNYGMNGILADDMGLGKTLQCLCAISAAHQREGVSKSLSLIIAPASVVMHWQFEANKYFPYLNVKLIFKDEDITTSELMRINGILVTSYKAIRLRSSALSNRNFTYCVLDEGHTIKDSKTQTAQAIAKLHASHRIILSGTPIQNDALELWALMDFLMPGYLGTRKEFMARFERYINKMFKPGATEQDTERGQQALDMLHRQVLPLIMRRLKNDVLSQLPQKVIYDEVIKPTQSQEQLLSRIRQVETLPDGTELNEHTFTKMKKERLLCIHPCLVEGSGVPCSIEHSAKLKELRKLLLTRLGFGGGDTSMRNRVLIFTLSKKAIDIVEQLVLKSIDGLTYAILDGRVPDQEKGRIVADFKRDDGKDVLLMTMAAGGVGLDLPVANCVIFVENSWNPNDDDQAMDRAHRLSQRNTVSVFNLVTSGTIEERIMEAQRRKRKIRDTIVNDENAQAQVDMSGLTDRVIDDKEPEKMKNTRMSMMQIAQSQPDIDKTQYEANYTNTDEWKK